MSQVKISSSDNSMEKGLFYFSGICVVGFSITVLVFSILKMSQSIAMILGIIVGVMTVLFGLYAGYMMASTRHMDAISSMPSNMAVGVFGVSAILIIVGMVVFNISMKHVSYSPYFTSLYAILTIIPIIVLIVASRKENSNGTILSVMSLVMILASSVFALGIVNSVENSFPSTGG